MGDVEVESSPYDDLDEPEPVRVGDTMVEPETVTWKVVSIISWYDGLSVFVAMPSNSPHTLLFRWAGGTDTERLYESDCHKGMRQPVYIKESEADLTDCRDLQWVDKDKTV